MNISKGETLYYSQPNLNIGTRDNPHKSNQVKVEGLSVNYGYKNVLQDISVTLESGCITGIIGPNGAGKSTMLKGLMRLIPVAAGKTTIDDQPLAPMRKKVAYVEQRSALDLSFPINVFETVLLGTYPRLGLIRRPGKEQKAKAIQALETVKMQDYIDQQIGELSGGQLQRVFIARALAQEAEIFLLDEPFVGIDMVSEELIMQILYGLRDQGKTIVIVHHDLHKVTKYFDNIIILNRILIAAGATTQTFTTENIRAAYGEALGFSIDEMIPKEVNPHVDELYSRA